MKVRASRQILLWWILLGCFGLWVGWLANVEAAPVLPPPPERFVADRAGMLRPATRIDLNTQLERFERATSSQIVVWVERKLPADTTLEGYVHDVFRHWRIGQARTNNGVLLAVFIDDRKVRIEVGRGLEGALPDVIAGRIINNEITPRFRANDFDGGVRAGVAGILAATRGEYRGTGVTVRDRNGPTARSESPPGHFLFFVVILLVILSIASRMRRALGRGQPGGWAFDSGGSSGGWGSGSGSGGDSGGFSGGGGDSGGGGASGSW